MYKENLTLANDPSEEPYFGEVKEMSAEDTFYSIDNPTEENYQVYITSLERNLKSKNEVIESNSNLIRTKDRMLKELSSAMKQSRPELGFWHDEIDNILKV